MSRTLQSGRRVWDDARQEMTGRRSLRAGFLDVVRGSGLRWLVSGSSALVLGAVVASAGESEASRLRLHGGSTQCAPGSVSAVIAGKHRCLKAGQTCKRSLDKQYHRYKFHCHTGRLARMKAAPAPQPPAPPPPAPLPGQRVDVGGYRLYIECIGTGTPTVIFEAGQGGAAATAPLEGATGIRQTIAAETRVCAYDRAGLGASEARPAAIAPTGTQYARELHALLAGANVPGPYVLVGPSYGGLITTAYASSFPTDTAGLVLRRRRHLRPDMQFRRPRTRDVRSRFGHLRRPANRRATGRVRLPDRRSQPRQPFDQPDPRDRTQQRPCDHP